MLREQIRKTTLSAQSLSHVQLFVAPWTIAPQAPLSMGFPRQKYWSGLPFPSPRDLPDLGIKPMPPALAGRFFTNEPPGEPPRKYNSAERVYPNMEGWINTAKQDIIMLTTKANR